VVDNHTSPVRTWLERLDDREDDLKWLSPYEPELLEVLRRGLNFPAHYHDSIDLLSRIFPHFNERYARPDDWHGLLIDALIPAMDFRDARLKANVFRHIGELVLKAGKVNAASTMFRKSLEDAETGRHDTMMLSALIGLMKLQWFDLTRCVDERLIERARKLSDESGSEDLRIEFYGALANLHFRQGYLSKALEAGELALNLAQQSGDAASAGRMALTVAGICRQMYVVQRDRETLDQAYAYLDLAAEKLSATEYGLQFTVLAYEQGVLDLQHEDYESAEEAFSEALAEAQRLKIDMYVTVARHGLGLAQAHSGKRAEARENMLAALEAWRRQNNRYEEVSVLQALGYLEQREGNRQQALEYLNQALTLCDQLEKVPQSEAMRQHIDDTIAEVYGS
jgi:tetratricopeptide (TPR) repeat protein